MMAKSIGVFRRIGNEPPMEYIGMGAFSNGYEPTYLEPAEFRIQSAPEFDVVAVCGGVTRYDHANARIIEYYRHREIPVIIAEFSWLLPDHCLLYLNTKPWVPPARMVDSSRRRAQGFEYQPEERGDIVLIAGQRPSLDSQLEEAVREIGLHSKRTIHYRRHPNAKRIFPKHIYQMPGCHTNSDEENIPLAQRSLSGDLGRAWVVLTHSSNVGHTALLRGLPVIASPFAAFREIAYPLEAACDVDGLLPPTQESVEVYFDRFAFVHWSHIEMRDGSAFKFLRSVWSDS